MKTKSLLFLAFAAAFGFGFAFKSMITASKEESTMKRVTGIGGVFFKCKDPEAMNDWYKKHLGFDVSPYGTSFEWRNADDTAKKGLTQWSLFKEDSRYFEPSAKDFMFNYIVDDMESLVTALKNEGVTILDEVATYDYGKFVHILDLEGNKIQLWEPTQ